MFFVLDTHIEEIKELPEVKYLSKTLLKRFISENFDDVDDDEEYEDKGEDEDEVADEDEDGDEDTFPMKDQFARFKVFVNWLSCTQNSEDSTFKKEIMELFDLNEFTCNQLTTCVQKSSLYSVEEIFNVLATKAVSLEASVEEGKSAIKTFEKKQEDYKNQTESLEKKVLMLTEQEKFLNYLENIDVNWRNCINAARKDFEAFKRKNGN